jgi:hypothetical protein
MLAAERIAAARWRLHAVDLTDVEDDLYEEWRRRQARREEREARRGRPRAANCFGCGRFKSRASTPCDYCGGDPVGNAPNGDPDFADRKSYDEAIYGERIL